jgi:hypothetical protein
MQKKDTIYFGSVIVLVSRRQRQKEREGVGDALGRSLGPNQSTKPDDIAPSHEVLDNWL